jgi:hypothetical protein
MNFLQKIGYSFSRIGQAMWSGHGKEKREKETLRIHFNLISMFWSNKCKKR